MKTLAELRTYIYTFLDIETVDLAPTLLDSWAKEGYDRIIKVARRQPHFEDSWEFDLVAGGDPTTVPDDLQDIEWVTVDGRVVEPIDYRQAYDQYVGWDGQAALTGWPTHYSFYNGGLYFWPVPAGVQAVVVHGWRKPIDWFAFAGQPDMPDPFESVLLSFMLYRAYGHQGLLSEAQNERNEFESQLAQLFDFETEVPPQQPLVLGGARRRHTVPAPLTFPIRYG